MRKTKLARIWQISAASLALLLCFAMLPLQALAEGESTSLPEDGTGGDAGTAPAGGMLYEPNFDVAAAAVYLVNEDSGLVIYEKNADTPMVSASLVKLMTCILVMEHIEDLDNTYIEAELWVFDELYGKNASTADIRRGESVSARELLYAMLLPSANEAALMVAGYISGGSMENFLYLMNQKAQSLGCTGTVFADPNGLSAENLTTAHDMYLIMREFMKYQTLVDIASTDTYEMAQHEKHTAPYNILSTNRILTPSSPYYTMASAARGAVIAGKTGSLGEWQNFVCAAEKDGMSFYSVVLDVPNETDEIAAAQYAAARPALYETQRLLEWAYSSFSIRSSLDTNRALHQIRVRYSTTDDEVKLLPTDDLKTILPIDSDDSEIEFDFDLPEYVDAPIRQGDVVGSVTLKLYGEAIGTSELVAAKDVQRNTTLYMVEKFKEFFGTWYFKLLLVLVGVGAVGYAGITVYLNGQKKKRRRARNPRR